MGQTGSRLAKELHGVDQDARFFGLENFGNTCYANSVLQALYFCQSFRDQVIEFADSVPQRERDKREVLYSMAELFKEISSQPKQVGSISPSPFITSVRQADRRFRNTAHHDAQEFLNFLLHNLDETVQKVNKQRAASGEASVHSEGDSLRYEATAEASRDEQDATASPPETAAFNGGAGSSSTTHGTSASSKTTVEPKTFVHDIFCGRRVTHTRCMNCETQSQREETFMELTLNLEPDTTLEQCMLASSKRELLEGAYKFHCKGCNSYQEAQQWVDLKSCPPVLIVHLNRLTFLHNLGREQKVKHRVEFGNDLVPPNIMDADDVRADADSDDGSGPHYRLLAVVVHMGASAAHGHYVSYVHVSGQWFCFDDGSVSAASQASVEAAFGASYEWVATHDTHAYLLFYERVGSMGAKSSDASLSGSADGGTTTDGGGGGAAGAVAEGAAAADVRVRMRSGRPARVAPTSP
eukprot:jgi/Ulvmu1/2388/UM130_0021.1